MKLIEIARSMVTRYGMSQKLGQFSYEGNRHGFLTIPPAEYQLEIRSYSETTAREIDCAVR